MKVILTGGTGFVGRYLVRRLIELGHDVTVLTRRSTPDGAMPQQVLYLKGDPTMPGTWQDRVPDYDAVINLAGTSIFNRWSDKTKRSIMESRIDATRNVVQAMAPGRRGKEMLLISASAVGYYGSRTDDEVLDEISPPGKDFLAQVSLAWEDEARKAADFGARVVITRFGIVLGRGGGALEQMLPPFKRGVGSPLGSGNQWFSWVHQEDLFRAIHFLIEKSSISDAVNCTAPNPVRNRDMTSTLLQVLGKPRIAPAVPSFLVKAVLGELGDVILKGQRVIPKRLLQEGFYFQFPTLHDALQDLIQ